MIHAGLSLLSLSGGSVSSVKVMTPTFSNDAGISSFIQDFSISVSRSRIFHLPAFLPYTWYDTYVFSTNIQSDHSANGRNAAAITLDILENQNIYRQ